MRQRGADVRLGQAAPGQGLLHGQRGVGQRGGSGVAAGGARGEVQGPRSLSGERAAAAARQAGAHQATEQSGHQPAAAAWGRGGLPTLSSCLRLARASVAALDAASRSLRQAASAGAFCTGLLLKMPA